MKTIIGNTATNAWGKVRVGDALRLINGRAFKPSEWKERGLPIVRIQNLNNTEAPFNYYEGDLPERFLLNNGDLLFAWSGTPGTSFGAHIWRGGKAWLNQHIFKVMFDDIDFNKKFLQLAINQNLNEYIRAADGGAGLAHITKGKFEDSELVKPPLEEQNLIVAEIDKQFSRRDEAVASLKRVKANLKRYKAAVLKAAVEGNLTEDWRKLHPNVEPAGKLLDRILAERRARWKGRGKYKEPDGPDTSNLINLPKGWAWATAEQLTDETRAITYGVIKLGPHMTDGIPVLRSSDVRSLHLELQQVKRVAPGIAGRFNRTFLRGDEILITVRGTLGGVVVAPRQCAGFNISREVAMLALVDEEIAKAMAIFIASGPTQRWLMQRTKGIAYTGINIETLKELPLPLPSIAEQQQIVAEVERRLSVIDELAVVVEANLTRADRLRQATLQKAFSGKLLLNGVYR